MKSSNFKPYLFAILTVALWGSQFAVAKFILPQPLSPLVFVSISTVLGTLFLLAIIIVMGELKAWWKIFKKYILTFLAIGIIIYSGANLLQFLGLSFTTAINQSIISNTQVFWVVFLNFIFYKEKPKIIFIIGAIFAFIGVFIVIAGNSVGVSAAILIGNLISLAAFAAWGGYTSFTKDLSEKENSLQVTLSIMVCSSFILLPLGLSLGGIGELSQLNFSGWLILLYLGIFTVGLAFFFWAKALSYKDTRSENISLITMLQPIVGIIIAIILLGEILTLRDILGTVIILAGMVFANLHLRKLNKEI